LMTVGLVGLGVVGLALTAAPALWILRGVSKHA
jgi:hypothetical protein